MVMTAGRRVSSACDRSDRATVSCVGDDSERLRQRVGGESGASARCAGPASARSAEECAAQGSGEDLDDRWKWDMLSVRRAHCAPKRLPRWEQWEVERSLRSEGRGTC